MDGYRLTMDKLVGFAEYLKGEEQGKATIEKYVRNVKFFAACTVNSKLSALNKFFVYAKLEECKVKFLHIQRKVFRDGSKDLTREEYLKLLEKAKYLGKEQLELAMETIGATGIRVSELTYITVEAAQGGRATVCLKGKVRVILIPDRLCLKLLEYAKGQGIESGEIFVTRSGKGLSRRQIVSA